MSPLSLPKCIDVQPSILITGFLGAGKTTLLRELLIATKASGLKSDVILNDYSDANMDLVTLEDHTSSIEPLTAACACCEGLDFLLELSLKSKESQSDLLFIELNGTADPVPIVESFTLLHEKLQLHPRWQICVIDVRNFGKRKQYQDIEELQLQTASHLYFTHESEEHTHLAILDEIRAMNPSASIVSKEEITEQIITIASTKKKRLATNTEPELEAKTPFNKSAAHHKAHEFTSYQLLLPDQASEDVIREWLAKLPEDIIRAKILIGVTEKPKYRYLFERVNLNVSKYIQRVSLDKDKVPNSAIFIGPNLNLEEITQATKENLLDQI